MQTQSNIPAWFTTLSNYISEALEEKGAQAVFQYRLKVAMGVDLTANNFTRVQDTFVRDTLKEQYIPLLGPYKEHERKNAEEIVRLLECKMGGYIIPDTAWPTGTIVSPQNRDFVMDILKDIASLTVSTATTAAYIAYGDGDPKFRERSHVYSPEECEKAEMQEARRAWQALFLWMSEKLISLMEEEKKASIALQPAA